MDAVTNLTYRAPRTHFYTLSSYPEWRMLRAENARSLGTFIFEDILCPWGAIKEIVTDNGPAFIQAAEFLSARYKINYRREGTKDEGLLQYIFQWSRLTEGR